MKDVCRETAKPHALPSATKFRDLTQENINKMFGQGSNEEELAETGQKAGNTHSFPYWPHCANPKLQPMALTSKSLARARWRHWKKRRTWRAQTRRS